MSQISDTAPLNPPNDEVRFMLQESLLVQVNQRTTRRKLELLRTEKKLIKNSPKSTLNMLLQPSKSTSGSNGKSKSSVPNTERNKVSSLRPMMLAFIFSSRLQEYSGTVPSKFNGLTKANTPQLQQTPYDTRKTQRPLVPFDSQ